MNNELLSELSKFLEEMVMELEIPSYIMDNLQTSYEAIGNVLNADDNDALKGHKVAVHYQGSIGLGTAIRPQNEQDDVDVDMICEVHNIDGWTQKNLKDTVGQRLKSRDTYRKLLDEEGTRCWKLKYRRNSERAADRYHVDILPATLAGSQTWTERINALDDAKPEWQSLLLYITDNKRSDYSTSKYLWTWLKSNPLAYRLWFELQCQRGRSMSIKSLRASIDPFPKTKEKSILQKAIMLLKQNRDIRYGSNEDKPISCIITTLAALAYRGEQDLASAIIGISQRMRNFIKLENGIYKVENPVNPSENFADKWITHPNRKRLFFEWLNEIEYEFGYGEIINKSYIERTKSLKKYFGNTVVSRTIKKIDDEMREIQDKGKGGVIKKTGILTTVMGAGTALSSGATFFGTDEESTN